MPKLIFCDLNESLVKKVKELFKQNQNNKWNTELEAVCGDVFECQKQNEGYKICTASNPDFHMGGGLDKLIADRFSQEIGKLKEFDYTDDIFYTISVDSDLKATEKIITRALIGIFAFRYVNLIFTGLGSSIGGMSEDDFLECLKKVVSADLHYANLSNANLSSANLSNADLHSADLHYANLSNANLSSANLSSAYLHNANLSNANLSNANLSNVDLHSADLHSANLINVNLSYANLRSADLSYANLSSAYLHNANLRLADLHNANLRLANLSSANLSSANLRSADLSSANLSQIVNFFDPLKWLKENFEFDEKGLIVYKRIGTTAFKSPNNWIIEPNSIIEELGVNPLPTVDCGSGVNFGTLDWCQKEYTDSSLWKCRINWMDLASVVVPYNTDGRARCQRLELLEKITG